MKQDAESQDADSAAIRRRIDTEPRHKTVLYRLIDWCKEPRFIEEIDERAAAFAEMRTSPFSARTVFSWLVDCGAVREMTQAEVAQLAGELEEHGGKAEIENIMGPDEEHLSLTGVFQATDMGIEAWRQHEEEAKMERLINPEARYRDHYIRVLEACRKPKSRREVEALFAGDPILENPKVYPSVFLDRLEQAEGLQWDEGWQTTEKGLSFLASLA